MNTVDIVLGLLLAFGFIQGIFKGFFVELASLVGVIAGIYGAIHFSHFMAVFLEDTFNWKPDYINLVSFALTFILIVVLVSLAGKMLTKIASFAALGFLNKLLGGVFGLIKSAFIASVIIMFLKAANDKLIFVDEETLEESKLYEPVEAIAPIILPSIMREVRERDILKNQPEEDSDWY